MSTTSISDVREDSTVTDYTGEVQTKLTIRLTDRASGGEPHTTEDFPFRVTVPCAATASTTIGSTCALTTTANSVLPGAVPELRRSMWALDRVEVYDGGPDSDADTTAESGATPRTFIQTAFGVPKLPEPRCDIEPQNRRFSDQPCL